MLVADKNVFSFFGANDIDFQAFLAIFLLLLTVAGPASAADLARLVVSPAVDFAIGRKREGVLLTRDDLLDFGFCLVAAKYFLRDTNRLLVLV